MSERELNHLHRYRVDFYFRGEWFRDRSFKSAKRAARYARRKDRQAGFLRRVVDTEASDE